MPPARPIQRVLLVKAAGFGSDESRTYMKRKAYDLASITSEPYTLKDLLDTLNYANDVGLIPVRHSQEVHSCARK
jgi:hypothetical protein